MSTRIKITTNVNLDGLEEHLEEVCYDSTLMYDIHNTLAKMCDPYVPFLHGPLSQTIEVSPQGVKYTQPYARRQYYGTWFNHTLDYHPLATALWDEAMMRDHEEEFNATIEAKIRRRYRELYG